MTEPNISEVFVETVSALFERLGRALICLDPGFRIVHVSEGLDEFAGEAVAERLLGRPVEDILGAELFGEGASLRQALEAGERREGWGASLSIGDGRSRMMSLSAAPVGSIDSPLCDPRVAYFLVVRAAEDPTESDTALPTIFAGMVGRSTAMLQIFRLIQNLAGSDATVLVTGESGTGKELVARATHVHSPRRDGPFVAVNCGALPGDLLESELFGHVRGAFTGAVRDRMGRFELAAGGTLFLDEVADLSLPLQVKLLRVLQERTFERVGESRSRASDARIIAATNRDLRKAVLEGLFREDLFYRLRVVPIAVPALRDRREDIEPVARYLLSRICARLGRSMFLSPDAVRTLLGHPWPGNIRELANALEYAVAVCRRQTLHAQDLPDEVQDAPTGTPADRSAEPESGTPGPDLQTEPLSDASGIRAALDAHRWNRSAAAEALGMSRTTLWRKMRELGITR